MRIKKKTLKYGIVIIIAIIILYVVFFKSSYPEVINPKPLKGNINADVKIVDYSDLQCPACKSFHPIIKQILQEFGDNISIEYKHFPLGFHKYAKGAAIASECANDQDAFWDYVDLVFASSADLTKSELIKIAKLLELDTKSFKACLKSDTKRGIVEADVRVGNRQNVQGTPTIFVNDIRLETLKYDDFKALIEQELASV